MEEITEDPGLDQRPHYSTVAVTFRLGRARGITTKVLYTESNDVDGCYDLAEDVTAEDLGRLAPIFPPDPEGRAEAADALGLDVNIRARLPASNSARAAGVG